MAVRKSKKGAALKKWFKEDWVDVKTGKECGRKSASKSKRPYPSCRPKKVASKMTAAEKRGLYSNINAKRKRIAAGSGETMRKPGSKGAPKASAFKKAAKTAKKR